MINTRIIVKGNSLKSILSLFNPDEEITKLQLGDVWHPSSGFVDESILNSKKTIQEILEFPYDFKGLVLFEAVIEDVIVKYINTEYEIGFINFEFIGKTHKIRRIINKTIELNAYLPNTYTILNQGDYS